MRKMQLKPWDVNEETANEKEDTAVNIEKP